MTSRPTLAPSYADARQRFLDAAANAGSTVQSSVHPDEQGLHGEPLAIDVVDLGPRDASAAMLVVSGTHGIEGFAGSALQSRWLESHCQARPAGLRVVLVHALNPFGFSWHRRTNEDNVDLNRNFIDWSTPRPDNAGYARLAKVVVPEAWDDVTQAATEAALLDEVAQHGLEAVQQIVSGGQFEFEAGVFYGGTGPTWSHRWLASALPELFAATERLGIIDLHTGLGPWGEGELIVHAATGTEAHRRTVDAWGAVRSMDDGESVSAVIDGDWLGAVPALLPKVEVTSAALEYGTVDPISVLQALRAEAWLHNYGDAASEQGDAIRAGVRSVFLDEDPAWLEMLSTRFDDVAAQLVDYLAPA